MLSLLLKNVFYIKSKNQRWIYLTLPFIVLNNSKYLPPNRLRQSHGNAVCGFLLGSNLKLQVLPDCKLVIRYVAQVWHENKTINN